MPATHLALLRAVNVGGKNKLPMARLTEFFIEAGCTGVRTYIQSGNVLFTARPQLARTIPGTISAMIETRLGFVAPVVLRSRQQLAQVIDQNPYRKAGSAEDSLFVVYLGNPPTEDLLRGLDPNRSPGDEYLVHGGEVYLKLGGSAADTRLTTAYFDSRLKTVSTCRNWRTILKLFEMMS